MQAEVCSAGRSLNPERLLVHVYRFAGKGPYVPTPAFWAPAGRE